MKQTFALICCLITGTILAQTPPLQELMKGYDFVGYLPESPRWGIDGKHLYFDWNPKAEPGNSVYGYPYNGKVQLVGNRPDVPVAEKGQKIYPQHYYAEDGILVRYDLKTGAKTTIFSASYTVFDVQRVKNEQHVYFWYSGNYFRYDAANGSINQVSQFTYGTQPYDRKDTSSLEKQQLELFGFVRDQSTAAEWRKDHQTSKKLPRKIWLSNDEQVEAITVSPNEQFLTFRISHYPKETSTYVENHITASGYTERTEARAKVGSPDAVHKMGIYDMVRDTCYFVSFSGLTDIRRRPAYFEEYGITGDLNDDKALIMHAAIMHESGNSALVVVRSYDHKERWIVLIDLATGNVTELDHQHDEAWIGGPGISMWNGDAGTTGWLDANNCYFQSEKTGYSHLYTCNINTKQVTALTEGNWEVHDLILSADKSTFYLLTNKNHPGVRNGYRLSVKDRTAEGSTVGKLTPLFEGNFGMSWVLSPDEKQWAIRYSTSTKPWEIYMAENKPGAKMIQVTKSTTSAFDAMVIKAPEVIQFKASDGAMVTARVYTPEKPNGAAVLFSHGAGYLQNAHYYWSHYFREFLFHQLLLSQGYTVMDVDYRASEGYGRDVRTAVYRHMGERDLLDFVDTRSYLISKGIDSNRVGIYGGSYGGFITLMAMLKTPGKFACGAALRSVTDWEHYNHEYTSNILNTPADDPKAFRQSSPIYFAEGLNGPLLMLHGMVDDNVQFQDIVRLNQRFIELGKKDFNLAVFPTEAHSFKTNAAWADEYRRIYELFNLYLR